MPLKFKFFIEVTDASEYLRVLFRLSLKNHKLYSIICNIREICLNYIKVLNKTYKT